MRRGIQKRIVSLVLTVALLLTSQSMVQMVYADETGTQERVIYISTPEQLMAISEEDTNCYYELENDIDLAGYDWVPVSMGADSTFNGSTQRFRQIVELIFVACKMHPDVQAGWTYRQRCAEQVSPLIR